MKNPVEILIVLLISCIDISAQDVIEIEKPILNLAGRELLIEYSLPHDNSSEYEVVLIAHGEKDGLLTVNHCEGDIGQGIATGRRKIAKWDLEKDEVNLDQSVSVRIIAYPLKKKYSRTGLLIGSAVIPGLGPSLVSDRKPYWLGSMLVYTGVASILYFNTQANDNYQLYLNAETRENNEYYYNLTQSNSNFTQISIYSTLGLWAANILWTMVMPNRPKYIQSKQDFTIQLSPLKAFNQSGIKMSVNYTF
ncbi:MAG: hypothetical protein WD052_07845 [Bacteroidales bacterium]